MTRHAQFPKEFSDLLSPRGLRVLQGRDARLCGLLAQPAHRFAALTGLLDAKRAESCRIILERTLRETLVPMETRIPPETIYGMRKNYDEWLPKTMKMHTAYLERKKERGYAAAQASGLLTLLQSESFFAFAQALSGRPLRKRFGSQVLCYGSGDYAGPHNDHHPEEPLAADGYFDMHVSFSSPAVAHQYLVYEKQGHLSHLQAVSGLGVVTAYRLPFWHYTTPLQAKPKQADRARRWVLLGTFLYR